MTAQSNIKSALTNPWLILFSPHRENIFYQILTSVVTIFLTAPFWVLMRFLTDSRVYGKSNLERARPPFLFISNHTSMLDDFFLGTLLFIPRALVDYRFMPYHTPEQKNFYRGPFFSWIMKHLKCIPLTRGKGIFQPGIQKIIDRLNRGGCVQIYPEGTRSRTGQIGKGKAGVGRIAYNTRCPVIPCYHSGLNEVLPIGTKIPRTGKKVRVIVGQPLDLSAFYALDNNMETWQKISNAMIDAISNLKRKLIDLEVNN